MQNTIKLLILLITCMLAITPAQAQQDENAFADEYGNTYRDPVKARLFPIIDDAPEYENDTFDDDDDPGSGEEGGGSVEDPEAPIDGKLLYLAFAGIAFAGLYYRRKI